MSTAAIPKVQGRTTRIPVTAAERWQEYLEEAPHDFYHNAAYHRFSEQNGAGLAFLAVYEEGERRLVWPYLLWPIGGLKGEGLYDVTSVYGYAGPLSMLPQPDEAFLLRAFRGMAGLWRDQGVVSVFTRFHPLLENHRLSLGASGLLQQGETISIDLPQTAESIWENYRKSLRRDIRIAREGGLVV